jgi:hypothetical protein
MNNSNLIRTLALTNAKTTELRVGLEPYWTEWSLGINDRIEFVGTGGDEESVYFVELDRDVVIWEWDMCASQVALNGNPVYAPGASPAPFRDWAERVNAGFGPKGTRELIRDARRSEVHDGESRHADPLQFQSICWICSGLAFRCSESALELENDAYYMIECQGDAPSGIQCTVSDKEFRIDSSACSEVRLWRWFTDDSLRLVTTNSPGGTTR